MSQLFLTRFLSTLLLCYPLGEFSADPDAYSHGTNISQRFDSLTLTAVSLAGVRIGNPSVFAYTPTGAAAATSTGSNNFAFKSGPRLVDQWAEINGNALRIEFDTPVDWVNIDAIALAPGNYAFFEAFDAAGASLGRTTSTELVFSNTFDTLGLFNLGPISSALAGGLGTDAVHLDNIVFGRGPKPLPGPNAGLLAVIGVLGLSMVSFPRPHRYC